MVIKNKVVEIVNKANKKGIAIAAGLVAVVGVAVVKSMYDTVDLPKPEFSIGMVRELWMARQSNGETYINAIVDDLTAADLGRFGEEVTKKVEGINSDTVASIIVGFKKK